MGSGGPFIKLVTRYTSAEEFIEQFARFTTETDIVAPALPFMSEGTAAHFVICLKDRSVMMKGRCEVSELRPASDTPAAAPTPALMRLRLREMDAHTCGLHLSLMERRASAAEPAASEAVPVDAPTGDTSAVTVVGGPLARSEAEPTVTSSGPESGVPGATRNAAPDLFRDLGAVDLASFVELAVETNGGADAASIRGGETAGGGTQADHDGGGPGSRSGLGVRADRRVDRTPPIVRRAAPYAASLILGMFVGIALKPSPKAAPMAVVSDRPPLPVTAAPAPAAAAPATPNEIPPAPPRDCTVRVTTTPPGAEVLWGDIALGSSPIKRVAIPCGPAMVTLRREHYAPAMRMIATERGTTAVVTQHLERPPAKLVVTSSPPNAILKLNNRRVGRTPREIDALRFERVRIEASLPGYQPWRKVLYLDAGESKIDVKLVHVRERSAERVTAPSVPPLRATPPSPAGTPSAVAAR